MAPFHQGIYRQRRTSDSLYALVAGLDQLSVDFNSSALIDRPSLIQAARLFNLSRLYLLPTPCTTVADRRTVVEQKKAAKLAEICFEEVISSPSISRDWTADLIALKSIRGSLKSVSIHLW